MIYPVLATRENGDVCIYLVKKERPHVIQIWGPRVTLPLKCLEEWHSWRAHHGFSLDIPPTTTEVTFTKSISQALNPSSTKWIFSRSTDGIGGYDLKSSADIVFAFDYNHSGKLDHIALYRPGNGSFFIVKHGHAWFVVHQAPHSSWC